MKKKEEEHQYRWQKLKKTDGSGHKKDAKIIIKNRKKQNNYYSYRSKMSAAGNQPGKKRRRTSMINDDEDSFDDPHPTAAPVVNRYSNGADIVAGSDEPITKKRYLADLIARVPVVAASTSSPVKSKTTNPAGGTPTKQTVVSVYVMVAGANSEGGPIGIAIPNSYLWREALKALANVGSNGQVIGECKFKNNLPLSIFFKGLNNGIFLDQFPDQLANAWYLCDTMAVFEGSVNGYPNFYDLAAKIAHGITTTTGSK